MSDMAILQVKNRDFQRAPADWLHKARQGDTVVIVSPEGPALTLRAGRPKRDSRPDWDGHFKWLKKQPAATTNPVDDLRRTDKR
jgi:hypothetical protein